MTTHELTKELSALVVSLRALSCDAQQEVAKQLQLEQRRYATEKRANKFCPPTLTIEAICKAVGGATRQPVRTVNLRQDVFERRYKKLAGEYADRLVAAVRQNPVPPKGNRYSIRYAGADSVHMALPKYDRTPVNAEAYAWQLAADYAFARLFPAYGEQAIRRYAEEQAKGDFDRGYALKEKIQAERDRWRDENTWIFCETDPAGQVVRINGIDPRPFAELLANAAGKSDPLAIINAAPSPVTPTP